MVRPRRLWFYLIFCVVIILSAFGLSSSYYNFWFAVSLLRRGDVCRLVAEFYLCGSDLDRQNGFDQSKISNYSLQYVEDIQITILSNL